VSACVLPKRLGASLRSAGPLDYLSFLAIYLLAMSFSIYMIFGLIEGGSISLLIGLSFLGFKSFVIFLGWALISAKPLDSNNKG